MTTLGKKRIFAHVKNLAQGLRIIETKPKRKDGEKQKQKQKN